jgi:YggT family protein
MLMIGNSLSALARMLNMALWLYMWLIIIRALFSWVNPDPRNPIVQFCIRATEPVLGPIRSRLPTWGTGLDLSPLVVILAIHFLQRSLVATLSQLAWNLR